MASILFLRGELRPSDEVWVQIFEFNFLFHSVRSCYVLWKLLCIKVLAFNLLT